MGRRTKRWEDDINQFLKPEETEETKTTHEHGWQKDQKGWEEMEKKTARNVNEDSSSSPQRTRGPLPLPLPTIFFQHTGINNNSPHSKSVRTDLRSLHGASTRLNSIVRLECDNHETTPLLRRVRNVCLSTTAAFWREAPQQVNALLRVMSPANCSLVDVHAAPCLPNRSILTALACHIKLHLEFEPSRSSVEHYSKSGS